MVAGYGIYRKHLERNHHVEAGLTKTQTQILRYITNNPSQLFYFSDVRNKDELARMIDVKYLSFSFAEKLGFINYCQSALNPVAKCVFTTTLTCTEHKIYKKKKFT